MMAGDPQADVPLGEDDGLPLTVPQATALAARLRDMTAQLERSDNHAVCTGVIPCCRACEEQAFLERTRIHSSSAADCARACLRSKDWHPSVAVECVVWTHSGSSGTFAEARGLVY